METATTLVASSGESAVSRHITLTTGETAIMKTLATPSTKLVLANARERDISSPDLKMKTRMANFPASKDLNAARCGTVSDYLRETRG